MTGYEHAFFLVLLLGYLLRDMQGRNQVILFIILGGLFLVLIPPMISVEISWGLILPFVLPWIFWKNAQRWFYFERHFPMREGYLWLITVLSLGLVLVFIENKSWIEAILIGIVVVSMLWQTLSKEGISTPLEILGPLPLIFLLVEAPLSMDSPRHYVGSFFSGASIGIAFGLISIALIKKVDSKYENRLSLGQVYLAYWTALMVGASAITAAVISSVVFVEFYQRRSDIKGEMTAFTRSDDRLPILVALGIFIFTAWQMHQPLNLVQSLEVGLVLIIGLLVTVLGRQMGLFRFYSHHSTWHSHLHAGLFLLGTLVLWPRGTEPGSMMTWTALGSAILLTLLTLILLKSMHNFDSRWYHDH